MHLHVLKTCRTSSFSR